MDQMTVFLEKLKSLGPKMESLKSHRFATLGYHALADAIYWSDEIPARLDYEEENALRFLLRHRTMLILGEPLEDLFKTFWDMGRKSFPNWIGFSERRVSPDPSVIQFYKRSAGEFDEQIDKLEQP
jgi:hypothetical protein